jgi:hypothetical protein
MQQVKQLQQQQQEQQRVVVGLWLCHQQLQRQVQQQEEGQQGVRCLLGLVRVCRFQAVAQG